MALDTPTIADAHAYTTIRQLKALKSDLLADFPALTKWENDMNTLEEVKAYMTSDCSVCNKHDYSSSSWVLGCSCTSMYPSSESLVRSESTSSGVEGSAPAANHFSVGNP